MTQPLHKRFFAAAAIWLAALAAPLPGALQTPVERSGYETWTPHARVVEFLTELEEASPLISKHLLGTSEEGREIFYVKVTADETFGQDDEKLKVLIYGQQHGAEPSGNDAILTLLRDFAAGKNLEWLEQMDLLIVPQVNPDGAETLQRRNAADVDLNRSHLILDGKEVRHLRELFHEWEPEVALDVHEYQPWAQSWLRHGYMRPFDVQFGLPTNLNVPAAIRDLAENRFLNFIGDHLESAGFSHHNYTVGNPDSIRYSTSNINDGRQGLAILGTFSLILEGRRERDNLDGIAHRTAAQTAAIGGLLQFAAENKDEVARAVRDSRKQLREGRVPEFVLTMSRAGDGEPVRLPVREVRRNDAGDWEEGEIVTAEIENYFPLVVAERKTAMPKGYILPADEQAAIELLRKHRVEHSRLEGGERFAVEQFRIDGFVEEVFEDATMIPTGSLWSGEYIAKAGDVYVPTSQTRGLMIATALEAQSMHGLIRYDRFSHWKQEGDFPVLRVVRKSEERAEAPVDFSEAAAKVDDLLEGWNRLDSPGGAVGVSKGGRPLLLRAYGMADLEHHVPNTPSTIFEAGSVSKQFVAAAVILLALDGKLSLDDDIRKHVPELPDYGTPITLHQLMTHTSGLRDWGHVATLAGLGRGSRSHNHDHVLDILSRQKALNFPPGERYSYSNSGYNLLAITVDRVAGESLAAFSQNRLFKPLGMSSTQWRDDYRRIVPGRASAYTGREGADTYRINRPIEDVHGNGGLLTTVGDLLTWNHALATGFFGDAFAKEMLRPGVLGNGRAIDYAGGLRIGQNHGQPVIEHAGATSGYRAFLAYYPEEDLSVALLFNVTGVTTSRLAREIAGFYLENTRESPDSENESPPVFELPADNLERYVGLYADSRNHRVTELTMRNGGLTVRGEGPLAPASERDFRLGGSGRLFRFLHADGGKRAPIRLVYAGDDGTFEEARLEPVNGFAELSAEQLAEFSGRYESPEAQVTLTVEVRDGHLYAKRGHNDESRLDPLYEDAFNAGQFGLIRFLRNETGRITEFACSRSRVYDLRFYRQ